MAHAHEYMMYAAIHSLIRGATTALTPTPINIIGNLTCMINEIMNKSDF